MTRIVCALAALATLLPSAADAAGTLHRYALVIGANSGGANRPQLQYAVSDAERFARVLVDLGGVMPGDELILRQPKLADLIGAIDKVSARINAARSGPVPAGRTEVIVYYSGHADDQGLLIGDDRYSYRTLRDRLDQIPADVRIAVLDACSSGAFTRIKGGKARPPFLVDESADMRGHAFLTSSSENEAAQESDRIRASYFTHYLISGVRGAADLSGDGKVTLSEAYQFAFNETLGRTVDTRGGAQHPSYDINLSGTGDVVLTDVRQTTATLVLEEALEGRFFIRTTAQELVVELYKPAGRQVELAIEPGTYEVRVERTNGSLMTRTSVAEGGRVALANAQFGPAAPGEPTRLRSGATRPRYAVAGRNRLALEAGMWRSGGATITTGKILDVMGALQYTRYLREDLAATLGFESFGVEEGVSIRADGIGAGTVSGLAMPLGLRWNPLKGDHQLEALKPFVSAGIGPVIGLASGSFIVGPEALASAGQASLSRSISTGDTTRATLGVRVGGGFDVQVGRKFTLGLEAGYNAMLNFAEPVGLHDNFNGPRMAVGIGWLFGRGE